MHSKSNKSIILILFIIALLEVPTQVKKSSSEILVEIENSFQSGKVDQISEYIDSKTYFSFTTDLSGYFSHSQIVNMLVDYFEAYKPLKFHFSSKSFELNSPFAWGEYVYLRNGIRGSHKIFISLQRTENSFYISQISINK